MDDVFELVDLILPTTFISSPPSESLSEAESYDDDDSEYDIEFTFASSVTSLDSIGNPFSSSSEHSDSDDDDETNTGSQIAVLDEKACVKTASGGEGQPSGNYSGGQNAGGASNEAPGAPGDGQDAPENRAPPGDERPPSSSSEGSGNGDEEPGEPEAESDEESRDSGAEEDERAMRQALQDELHARWQANENDPNQVGLFAVVPQDLDEALRQLQEDRAAAVQRLLDEQWQAEADAHMEEFLNRIPNPPVRDFTREMIRLVYDQEYLIDEDLDVEDRLFARRYMLIFRNIETVITNFYRIERRHNHDGGEEGQDLRAADRELPPFPRIFLRRPPADMNDEQLLAFIPREEIRNFLRRILALIREYAFELPAQARREIEHLPFSEQAGHLELFNRILYTFGHMRDDIYDACERARIRQQAPAVPVVEPQRGDQAEEGGEDSEETAGSEEVPETSEPSKKRPHGPDDDDEGPGPSSKRPIERV